MSLNYPIIQRLGTAVPVAADITTDTGNFNKVLGAGDDDLQKVSDAVDDILDGSSSTEVLFNEAGRPVGDAGLTYDKTTGVQSVGAIQLDTSLPAPAEAVGLTFWDSANRTISTVLENGVVGQHFEETFIAGQNDTGSTLVNGTVATYAGSIGNSGNIRIAGTVASASEPAFMTLGIVTEPIVDGERGKVTTYGKARGIQTNGANYSETWADGEVLYKSSTVAGGLTNVAPQAPIPAIPIAVVISAHPSNGTLLVRPTYPQALTMLTDVNGTPATTDGQILTWHQTEGYFDFDKNINSYALLTDVHWVKTGTTIKPKVTTDAVEWGAFKYQAATTGGTQCSFIGEGIGANNTGAYNTGIGYSALYRNTSGGSNIGIGRFAGYNNLTGANNISIGVQANFNNTTNNNVAIGTAANLACVSGQYNIAIGTSALTNNLASGNGAIGRAALRDTTTGTLNYAFGDGAGILNQTGSRNFAFGSGAFASSVTGDDNVVIGTFAGFTLNGANENVAVGTEALKNCVSGGGNLCVGYKAGLNCTGDSNVLIGYNVAATQTAISNELWVANSNTATPLLWGDFSAEILKVHGDLKIPSDSKKLHLGAGDDMTVGYDGTKGTVDTSIVAPSDLDLNCGTEKTLRLVESVYDDLPPAVFSNAKIPTSQAPTWTTFLSGGVNEQYRFGVNDYLFVSPIETTHKYKEGTDFSLHLHWSTGQGTDGTDRAVKWEVTYTIADGNEAFYSEVTLSAEETITAGTAANTHKITGIGDITGSTFKIGAYIIATVKRIAAAGTAPSNDPFGLALGVHVEQDTMGSRQLFIK